MGVIFAFFVYYVVITILGTIVLKRVSAFRLIIYFFSSWEQPQARSLLPIYLSTAFIRSAES
jgi:hypothetical protein